jgi:hypothetical protein
MNTDEEQQQRRRVASRAWATVAYVDPASVAYAAKGNST